MPSNATRAPGARQEAVRAAATELEAWRARAIPDPSAPLEAEDVARLVRDCLTTFALGDAAATDFTVNTVHYYRRKEIVDAPEGRTSAARYGLRHLWQAVGARLAGQLGLLTLAEARKAMRDEREEELAAFVAERIVDARAREAVRSAPPAPIEARPLASSRGSAGGSPVVVQLPGNALCVIPATHPARRSAIAARALGRALTDALRTPES